MNDHKQYADKVMEKVIDFMAMMGARVIPTPEEAKRLLDEIPEELHQRIIAALSAAQITKRIAMMKKMAESFPKGDILKEGKPE